MLSFFLFHKNQPFSCFHRVAKSKIHYPKHTLYPFCSFTLFRATSQKENLREPVAIIPHSTRKQTKPVMLRSFKRKKIVKHVFKLQRGGWQKCSFSRETPSVELFACITFLYEKGQLFEKRLLPFTLVSSLAKKVPSSLVGCVMKSPYDSHKIFGDANQPFSVYF